MWFGWKRLKVLLNHHRSQSCRLQTKTNQGKQRERENPFPVSTTLTSQLRHVRRNVNINNIGSNEWFWVVSATHKHWFPALLYQKYIQFMNSHRKTIRLFEIVMTISWTNATISIGTLLCQFKNYNNE